MKFLPNLVLDLQRRALKEKYDQIFARIRKAIKGSIEHRQLLRDEWTASQTTRKFLKNPLVAQYFKEKRKDIYRRWNTLGIWDGTDRTQVHHLQPKESKFDKFHKNRWEGIFDEHRNRHESN